METKKLKNIVLTVLVVIAVIGGVFAVIVTRDGAMVIPVSTNGPLPRPRYRQDPNIG